MFSTQNHLYAGHKWKKTPFSSCQEINEMIPEWKFKKMKNNTQREHNNTIEMATTTFTATENSRWNWWNEM